MKAKTNISVRNNLGSKIVSNMIIGESGEYTSGDILDANAVQEKIDSVIGFAPEDLDTIAEAAQAIVTIEGDVEDIQETIDGLDDVYAPKVENGYIENPDIDGVSGQILSLDSQGNTVWSNPAEGSVVDGTMSDVSENPVQNKAIKEYIDNYTPALAENLAPWADQKTIATPDTYSDAVRTTGGDIPIETSAGAKLESIKPVAGSKWTAKMLFNGSYNMLNATTLGAEHSQPYVGGVGSDFVYFLVPELTLGTFGTADENNGLLFTDEDGVNVQPTSVYYKPLGATVPQSLTDGTSVTPTSVSYDGKTYKTYETSAAGWLIIPKTYYDNDICAHIAWEDWYDKHVSLSELTTNPEAVAGILMLEGLLSLAHSDKYLRGVNDEVCDNVVFGDTSATISHVVDELSVAAASWANSATGESDSQGNVLYRHSATVSGIKNGGAACVEGEDGGIPLTVIGTTVSYVDTNATAPASTVFYQIPTAETYEKAYTDSVFSGSNIDTATGVLPINDCSIEAQVVMDGEANITVKYAKNIVDQVAINATVDVPQIKKQVEEHEERIEELENTAVRTGSYDASVAVGLADNFKGDTIVDAEFYKRKTGSTQSVGSGIAAIKEMRGKSIVWNQKIKAGQTLFYDGVTSTYKGNLIYELDGTTTKLWNSGRFISDDYIRGHKYYQSCKQLSGSTSTDDIIFYNGFGGVVYLNQKEIVECTFETSGLLGFQCSVGTIFDKLQILLQRIDLTLMFGAGNEPATVAEFEKMFPLDYYDYNAGEVIPFAGQNLVTTGFNQWNEEWELGNFNTTTGQNQPVATQIRAKNPFPVLPSTQYFAKTSNIENSKMWALFLDAGGNIITDVVTGAIQRSGNCSCFSNNIFTTPTNARYMRFYMTVQYGATYNYDICINISDPDRNGTYKPYEKHTLPLDPSQWRDKNGELVFPYGGMHGVGTAYDYAKVDADGYIRKAVRVFGQVDLGSLNWETLNAGTSTEVARITTPIIDIVLPASASNRILIKCSKYTNERYNGVIGHENNKLIGVNTIGLVAVYDYSLIGKTASQVKSAMSGVMFIYQLATPIEVELATPVYANYLVDKDGVEEITPANGSTPYTTMANLSILYAMDARDEIKNLPKNYISKESAENMLNAMVTAGIIESYTMTWDAANSRYAFVITAPEEPESEETNA